MRKQCLATRAHTWRTVMVCGPRPVFYFGELYPQGLLIPREASARAMVLGFPSVEPHLRSYASLLDVSENHWQSWSGERPSQTLCDWLGEYRDAAW